MANIKTLTLSAAEVKVDGIDGQNTIVQNLGNSSVYASVSPGIVANADDVAEIPAGGALNIYGTCGTIYLKGAGKVQLFGTDYADLNCVSSSAASGGSPSGGTGGCGITKEDIDKLFDESSSGSPPISTYDYVITKEEIDSLFKKN